MTLDDIKPDVTMTLTEEHERLFQFAGCEPACHACDDDINVGQIFQLATHDDRDVMLCGTCDIDKLKEKEAEELRASLARRRSGGYSRPTRS